MYMHILYASIVKEYESVYVQGFENLSSLNLHHVT